MYQENFKIEISNKLLGGSEKNRLKKEGSESVTKCHRLLNVNYDYRALRQVCFEQFTS